MKYGVEGGGRDSTGSPNYSGENVGLAYKFHISKIVLCGTLLEGDQ